MNRILNQLKEVGVHNIISDEHIILEVLEDNLYHADKIDSLINVLFTNMGNSEFKKVLLECPGMLLDRLNNIKEKMKIKGERAIYKRSLRTPIIIGNLDYEIWSPTDKESISFLSEVMCMNKEHTKNFLLSMETELPTQVQRMFTIYKVENEPVGAVFPHLEPDKDKEGRIFWIGIHPKFRGKGLGKNLHLIGLYRLQQDFKAKSYLGMTQIINKPMKKVMVSNGCIENKKTVISLEYSFK